MHIYRDLYIYTHIHTYKHILGLTYTSGKRRGKEQLFINIAQGQAPKIQFMLLVKTYFTNPLGFKGILVTSSRSRQTFIKSLQKALILVKLLNVTPQTMLPSQ